MEYTQVRSMHPPEDHERSPTPSQSEEATATVQEKAESNTPDGAASRLDYWWGWDILALSFALAVLVAIIVILCVFDGKEQPNWRYMSLNTLLSWLSTVGKACILFPASATLSQLKWVWFAERKRPLSDLRVFDSASRGIYGSAELLWALKMRHFAVLGAIAIMLALGFEPFIQNLVHYSASLVEDGLQSSILANSSYYDSVGSPSAFAVGAYYIDPTLKANVYNSIFNMDPSKPWSIPQYTCPTGNCTWDPVPSLAVRALCSDVTSSLKETCEHHNDTTSGLKVTNCTLMLQNGASVYHTRGTQGLDSIALMVNITKEPLAFHGFPLPAIQRIEAVEANTVNGTEVAGVIIDNPTYVATECTLEPIVRSVRASVTRSRYKEDNLAEWSGGYKFNESGTPIVGYGFSPKWNESLGMHSGQKFTLSPFSALTITDFIKELFTGYAGASNMALSFNRDPATSSYATTDVIEMLLYGELAGCENLKTDRFRCAMKNIAGAMSKSFRDQAYINDTVTANLSVGHTMANAIIVHIRWQWLTLPLLVWLITAVAWAGTEWKTRRASMPKWTDNPLPLLFLYRGDSEDSATDVEGMSGEAYVQRARDIEAQLRTGDRAALVQ